MTQQKQIFTNIIKKKLSKCSIITALIVSPLCFATNTTQHFIVEKTIDQQVTRQPMVIRQHFNSGEHTTFEYLPIIKNANEDEDEDKNKKENQVDTTQNLKELFEKHKGVYMVQGKSMDIFMTEKPVNHLKDLQVMLVADNILDSQCSGANNEIHVKNDANFYGDALLLDKPTKIKSILKLCDKDPYKDIFKVSFSNGSVTTIILSQGELSSVASQMDTKRQKITKINTL